MALFVLADQSEEAYLHQVALDVTAGSMIMPGEALRNFGRNTTGYVLRVPGASKNVYPAFWVRDASMMLGADLVPEKEIQGWIRVIAATQPGPGGLRFDHGLRIPGYSIPDHVTLQGAACWYPGAFTEQGNGTYGMLPPADDAFYFIHMAKDQVRLAGNTSFFKSMVRTGWGDHPVSEVCERAFDSVATDPATGLVVCDPVNTRVDWGFCDSIRKTGSCLMPSLLRWVAANELKDLFSSTGASAKVRFYAKAADQIRRSVEATFYRALPNGDHMMVSATVKGNQDDVWASAFACHIGILSRPVRQKIAKHLMNLVAHSGISIGGQIRHMPRGEYWEDARCPRDSYQNGGYWSTPTGWFVSATGSRQVLADFLNDLRKYRAAGAPFEWISGVSPNRSNANYAASITLVYTSLKSKGYWNR